MTAQPEEDPTNRQQRLRSVPEDGEWEEFDFTREAPAGEEEPPEVTFALTDVGNAERLAAMWGGELRWCERQGRWLIWDGMRWRPDLDRYIDGFAVAAVRSIAAGNPADDKVLRWARSSESNRLIEAMLRRAKGLRPLQVTPEQLDADPMVLNVLNGTLDLSTGRLRAHDRADYLTRVIPAQYSSDAQAPRWQALLDRVLPDREVQKYLQRFVGYSLTARTDEEAVLLLHGSGANGKSVIVKVLMGLFSDYAQAVPKETLVKKRYGGIPNDVARMVGVRLLSCVETEEGRQLDESLLKQLASGDKVSARMMRQEFFDFTPTGKFMLATNHLPQIRNQDDGIWRRIKVIPFTVQIPVPEQDKTLPQQIIGHELEGVLAWAVAGCLDWQRLGLPEPSSLRVYTNEYRKNSDLVGQWLEAETEADSSAVSSAQSLYESYKRWCDHSGLRAMSIQSLSTKLTERGYKPVKDPDNRRRQFEGLRLREQSTTYPGYGEEEEED